ncbi:unnamed protein product [Sphagnum balticum]
MACVASDPRWVGFRDSILETLGISISTRIAQFHQPMHHVRDPSFANLGRPLGRPLRPPVCTGDFTQPSVPSVELKLAA